MHLKNITLLALSFALGTGILFSSGNFVEAKETVVKKEAYYTTEKFSGYKKGEFTVLMDDDVNFRSGPSTTAAVLACLPRHSLFRIVGEQEGDWQKVEWAGKTGYVFAAFLKKSEAEGLIEEDNSLGDWQIGQPLGLDTFATMGGITRTSKEGNLQVYSYPGLEVKVKRNSKKIEALSTTSPIIYTMRGVGVGDSEARVVGQYGIPSRVVYLGHGGVVAGDEDIMIYSYDFLKESNFEGRIDFYINANGDVSKVVLCEA